MWGGGGGGVGGEVFHTGVIRGFNGIQCLKMISLFTTLVSSLTLDKICMVSGIQTCLPCKA